MRTTTAAAAAAAAAGQMHRCLSRSQDAALYGPSPQIEKSIRQSPAAASKFRLETYKKKKKKKTKKMGNYLALKRLNDLSWVIRGIDCHCGNSRNCEPSDN